MMSQSDERRIAIRKLSGSTLPANVPHTLFPDLVRAFVPTDKQLDSMLEIVITITGDNIPAREFGYYLALIDRVHGRLSPEGLRSYAHSESGHLYISEIHKSELEVIFRTLLHDGDTVRFVAIFLFLRSIPNMFKLAAEGVKNIAEAYKSYQEGAAIRQKTQEGINVLQITREKRKLSRVIRKEIREAIKEEPAFKNLSSTRQGQVITLLAALAKQEEPALPSAIRFARRQVKSIVLRTKKDS
jgi:hypothetical protein